MLKGSSYGLWALAAAVALVAAVWTDADLVTLLPLFVVLACPLVMLLLMRGMTGDDGRQNTGRRQDDHGQHPTSR